MYTEAVIMDTLKIALMSMFLVVPFKVVYLVVPTKTTVLLLMSP